MSILDRSYTACLFIACGAAIPCALEAQGTPADTGQAQVIDALTVTGRNDDLIGIAATASEGRVGAVDLRLRPITREGELLETVPGMIVTQHSGDGKANQYFIRGFNLDHGTDFKTRIEGMPVNMPSHAHGQGYTDLNFLVPSWWTTSTTGWACTTPSSAISAAPAVPSFTLCVRSTGRLPRWAPARTGWRASPRARRPRLGGGDLLLGGEAKTYDGPWDVAQDIRKLSGLARYTLGSRLVPVLASRHGRTATSGTPPTRSRSAPCESGLIDRFGLHRRQRRRRHPALQPVGDVASRRGAAPVRTCRCSVSTPI